MAKFVVTQNGRVIDRGFRSYQQAWQWVNDYVHGLESHKRSSKIYTADFNVREDRVATQAENQIWRDCKTHTQVRI